MIFLRIWNYFFGYVVIKVDGLSLEKFINLCISRGVKLWGIKRINYTSLTANISIKDFRSLPPIVRVIGCRVRIIDKKGFPFLAHRYKHRKMLIGGMLIFLVALYVLSSFVWIVEVEGVTKIDEGTLYNLLEEKGIKPGIYKGKLNLWEIENEMLIEVPELSWISIELIGTKAIARVVERVKPPSIIDTSTPCNVVASKDGIISQVIPLEGDVVVGVGDTVKKGQLLISGIIDHDDAQIIRYVHARGNIFARTWYEGKGQASFDRILKTRTGEKVVQKLMETKNWEINISNKEIPFADYEMEERKESLGGIGEKMGLNWIIREYYEVETNSSENKDELAKEEASNNAIEDALKNIPKGAKIIDKKFNYDIIKDKGYEVIVYVEVLEDIAEQVELSVN